MNKINKLLTYGIVGGALVFAGSGCDKFKDFGNTNVNPNGSSEVLTSALITNVESYLGNPIGIGGATTANPGGAPNLAVSALNPGHYCQYFAEPTYPGNQIYNLPQFNSSGTYSSTLMDCQVVINKNYNEATKGLPTVLSGGSNRNQIAIAKVLQAFTYWKLTDAWGDLPYTEALKGTEYLTPKYDAQETIYKGILDSLASTLSATTGFDDAGIPVKGDIVFAGNNAKWKKVVNSMRMLIALRLSKRYPGASEYAATQFKAAAEHPAGHITANADNFTLAYAGGNYRNPWFSAGASEDNGVAKTFTDVLTGLGDTRISALASTANGIPYGDKTARPNTSKILNPTFRTETAPLVIINAASIWLAKSEAIERTWITGDSKAAYDAGVTASFEQWGAALPASYLTSGAANFTTGTGVAAINTNTLTPGANATTSSKLSRIALQQWIAFYPDGLQGWSNWRRTAVPDIKPTIYYSPSSTGQIIRRYVYGTVEYALNNTNLQTALTGIPGGDKQESRVWWDRP